MSLGNAEYFAQIAQAQAFQEPISFDDWAAGKRYSDPVELSNINRVPVSIVVSMNDQTCPPEYPEWHYAEITSPEKYIRYEQGRHWIYSIKTTRPFIERMAQTLDSGKVDDAATSVLASLVVILTSSLALMVGI